MRLSAPFAGAEEGVSLGGASVGADGSFAAPLSAALPGAAGRFLLTVRPASVAVVTLSRTVASTSPSR